MTPSELAAELRRMSEQATPGPWGHGEGPCGPYLDYQARPPENIGHEPTSDYDGREPLWLGGSVDASDRALICLLRNNLPTILAALAEAAGPVEWTDLDETNLRFCERYPITQPQSALFAKLRAFVAAQKGTNRG